MNSLLLFILALGSLIFFVQWQHIRAQKRLEGKIVPDIIQRYASHPNGVLYYFHHPMCGPCKKMLPVIDHLNQDYPGRVIRINVSEDRALTLAMGIKATPTTVFVKDNYITKAIIGFKPEQYLKGILTPDASLIHPTNTGNH